MTIEKMSVDEMRIRVTQVMCLISELSERLTADMVKEDLPEVTLCDEEVQALTAGMVGALNFVASMYMGGLDESLPETVISARAMSPENTVDTIIKSTATVYYEHFVAGDGDEQ